MSQKTKMEEKYTNINKRIPKRLEKLDKCDKIQSGNSLLKDADAPDNRLLRYYT